MTGYPNQSGRSIVHDTEKPIKKRDMSRIERKFLMIVTSVTKCRHW